LPTAETLAAPDTQPSHLIYQAAILDAQCGRLASRALKFLSEHRKDRAQLVKALDQVVTVDDMLGRAFDAQGMDSCKELNAAVRASEVIRQGDSALRGWHFRSSQFASY
jgi:hypothetical protein